jgi:FPC/CPF motif-containing protein YcgG
MDTLISPPVPQTGRTLTPARPLVWSKAAVEAAIAAEQLPAWAAAAYIAFAAHINDPHFPCTFATQGQRHGKLRYAFADSATDPAALAHMGAAIRAYLAEVQTLAAQEAVMTVLALFIHSAALPAALPAHHAQAWCLLQYLHDHDPAPWPASIPRDPEDPAWAFCYAGVPLFVNISTPAHLIRRSRHVSPALTLVLQPREGFDLIAGAGPKGQQVRRMIRDRLLPYDGEPASPELDTYQAGGSCEWRQYGLPDTNAVRFDHCPLAIRPEEPADADHLSGRP